MRKCFTLLLVLLAFAVHAQQYNNEWIRYNQTYYKFKVGKTGLYRISKATLDAAGIGSTQVQFFELWRNGVQVPFYPSVAGGALPSGGYIEFWGQANDGKPDRPMYRDTAYQHSTALSLITDTSTYFLSINTNQSGFLVWDAPNDVASNTLPVEPYFMYSAASNYRNRINLGFAAVVGEYVYSSSYDKGEFWSTDYISPSGALSTSMNNLFPYTAGPNSELRFGAVGDALNPRSMQVQLNGTQLADTVMDYFNDVKTAISFPTTLLNSGSATLQYTNTSGVSTDRAVISFAEITYPRQFNFGGQKNFEFTLPADNDGYYVEISNFNNGSVEPVLYDLTFGSRYVGDISVPGLARFVLPASTNPTNYVLVSEDATNVNNVTSLTTRNFIKFSDVANQGDYLIISNPSLYAGTHSNNPVDDYKNYRLSVAGGAFNVKTIEIEELVDQFAFGIKQHPLSVRNFLGYAKTHFSAPIKNVFLIGRGMSYVETRIYEADPIVDRLNLVPTFGYPASDNLLSAGDITNPVPDIPIGRLSVVKGSEIEDYLEKVVQYESLQKTAPNTVAGRDWMKNVVHITGSGDPYLGTVLCNYMHVYQQIIEDTLFGGKVTTFCKTSTDPIEELTTERIGNLFAEGISILTYFGHSSSTTLEFNLDNPQSYNNNGKYPVFFVNGCNAGNFFTYYPQRFSFNETISEKFVLAKQRGSIAFVASTHFGIVNYLNLYLTNLYASIDKNVFSGTLGEINQHSIQGLMNATGPYDYYSRMHAEEITLHGDPALHLNVQPKPDYVIEEQLIKIDPTFVSVAENDFKLKVKVINIGRAVDDSVTLEIKRQFPDGSTGILYTARLRGIRYADSVVLNVPIIASRDKGPNKIFATIDVDSKVDEMAENNNSASKDFFIYEDEARPIYPYNLSIVNTNPQKLYASTANALNAAKDYIMEIDTTEKFNSTLKVTKTVNSIGGILEFDPGISYLDSTVYYWRVALVAGQPSEYRWNDASFIYINGPEDGYNQSHYYQHLKSEMTRISLDSATRSWIYGKQAKSIFARNGVFPTAASQASDFAAGINGHGFAASVCGVSNVIFNVIDPITFQPLLNANFGPGQFGSDNVCGFDRRYNFQFTITDTAKRRKIVEFMDLIPDGSFVVVRNTSGTDSLSNTYAPDWVNDTTFLGSNNSMYHRLLQQGFTGIDSFVNPRAWIFIYQKNHQLEFLPKFLYSQGVNDKITLTADCFGPDTLGIVTSPKFGPAKAWKEVVWKGSSMDNPTVDNPRVDVIGIDSSGNESVLYALDINTPHLDLSNIDARQYPYLRLQLRNADSLKLTPYQLQFWRIYYSPVPEGGMAPNIYFTSQDTLDIGDKLKFGVAFKNVSKTAFDSLAVKVMILDKDNVQHFLTMPRKRPIITGDSIIVQFELDTKDYPGLNILFVEVNPDNDQPEQYHFNNFVYKNVYVKADFTNPLLDVTFDGVHILNRDIVSSKPRISIKLKDEAKFLLLNDTALSSVQIRFPDQTLHTYHFDGDTLRFTPATSGDDNTASIDFLPQFIGQVNPQGDDYELIVKGKDRSNNKAGEVEYRVTFRVITKPMISNLLNYPNPFSTSTAFVFTITGSEIPQNIKIQILTVTGKIVREITKDELGPLHIGRNITTFRWNGMDQYNQKLGNGVYLYRVVTTLNGKRMDKFKAQGDDTDRYFNNGYGKMYLMR